MVPRARPSAAGRLTNAGHRRLAAEFDVLAGPWAHHWMMDPVFVYDGDCAFCSRCAQLIQRWIPTRARVAPWRSVDLGKLGLTRADCAESVWWVDADRIRLAGPDAIARLLVDAGSLWAVPGRLLRLAPVRALAWPIYRWVARNRQRLPGATAACALPAAPESTGRTGPA